MDEYNNNIKRILEEVDDVLKQSPSMDYGYALKVAEISLNITFYKALIGRISRLR